MKIKQEIEWVVGELPETQSLKLVNLEFGDVKTVRTAYYNHSRAAWIDEDSLVVYSIGNVCAWASIPLFQGFPAEGQKTELGDVYRCDQKHPDPVVERLIEAVGFLGKESERRLWSEFEDPDHKYGSDLDKLKHLDVYVRTGKVEA